MHCERTVEVPRTRNGMLKSSAVRCSTMTDEMSAHAVTLLLDFSARGHSCVGCYVLHTHTAV